MTPPRSSSFATLIAIIVIVVLAVRAARGAERIVLTESLAFADLSTWEGYRTTVYPDAKGTWSVGVGHNLGPAHPRRRHYTDADVRALFHHDFLIGLSSCRAGVADFDSLPLDVQLMTLGLVWGVGPTGFTAFKSLRLALSYRAYDSARIELALSKWARQVQPARRDAALRVLGSH